MKYILSVLLVLTVLLTGCASVPKQTVEQVYFVGADTDEAVALSEEECEAISEIWQEESWSFDNTKDVYDYVFETSKGTIRYSSESGLFNDITHKKHVTVSSQHQFLINTMLGCGDQAD